MQYLLAPMNSIENAGDMTVDEGGLLTITRIPTMARIGRSESEPRITEPRANRLDPMSTVREAFAREERLDAMFDAWCFTARENPLRQGFDRDPNADSIKITAPNSFIIGDESRRVCSAESSRKYEFETITKPLRVKRE